MNKKSQEYAWAKAWKEKHKDEINLPSRCKLNKTWLIPLKRIFTRGFHYDHLLGPLSAEFWCRALTQKWILRGCKPQRVDLKPQTKPVLSQTPNLQLPQLSKRKTHKQFMLEDNKAITLPPESTVIMTAGPLAKWRKKHAQHVALAI